MHFYFSSAFGDDILQEIESMENGSVGQKKENDNPVKQDGEAAMEEEEKVTYFVTVV